MHQCVRDFSTLSRRARVPGAAVQPAVDRSDRFRHYLKQLERPGPREEHSEVMTDIVSAMQGGGLMSTTKEYTVVIRALARRKAWRHAIAVFSNMEWFSGQRPDAIAFGAVANACERASRWKEALLFFWQASSHSLRLGLVAYTSAITACDRGHRWHDAFELFDNVLQSNLKPDRVCYSMVLNACDRGLQWSSALEVFDHALQSRLPPDSMSLSAVVSACEQTSHWQKCLRFFGQAHARNLDLGLIAYSSAISMCERGSWWIRALQLYNNVLQSVLQPDAICYTALARACERGHQWSRAFDLMDEALCSRVALDVKAYNTAISVCKHAHQWETALQLLVGMRDKGIEANTYVYSTVANVCEFAHQWVLALHVLVDVMETANIEHNAESFNVAINACRKRRLWAAGLQWLGRMISQGVSPDESTYAQTMLACFEVGQVAKASLLTQEAARRFGLRDDHIRGLLLGFSMEDIPAHEAVASYRAALQGNKSLASALLKRREPQ